MAKKTLEQLYAELDTKVAEQEMSKTASYQAGSKLEDIWDQVIRYDSPSHQSNSTQEDQDMDNLHKMAAMDEALNNMSIAAALDSFTSGMTKSASMQKVAEMQKEAGAQLVLQHCYNKGVSPDYCIQKEASDRTVHAHVDELQKLAAEVARRIWYGFNKAAADDVAPGPGTMGANINKVTDDYQNKANPMPQTFPHPSGPVAVTGPKKTVDGMVAQAMNAQNYGAQGQIQHPFLS